MGIPRLISILLLALSLYLLGQDAAALFNGTGGVPQSLETVWRRIDSESLYAAQSFIERHLTPEFWDSGIAVILRLPAWTLPLGLGLGLLGFDIFSQGRKRGPSRR